VRVVVKGVATKDAFEMPFAHNQEVIQALRSHGAHEPVVSENPIQPMIRDLVFLSPLHPTLGATERRNLGTDVLAPISFLPWWDDAAQCQAFDLIRGLIEILVPFTSAFGSRAVTDDIVRSALRLEYWLMPAFQDSQAVPSFLACGADKPKSVVSPEEFPLTYAWAGVTLIAKSALPSKRVSEPLVVPTSAIIFSVVDDALECAINTT
jgi:hypothetical protein